MKGGISKKALAVWEIGLALLAAVLVVLVLVIFYPRTWIWYALLWIIGFAYVFFSFLYLPLPGWASPKRTKTMKSSLL